MLHIWIQEKVIWLRGTNSLRGAHICVSHTWKHHRQPACVHSRTDLVGGDTMRARRNRRFEGLALQLQNRFIRKWKRVQAVWATAKNSTASKIFAERRRWQNLRYSWLICYTRQPSKGFLVNKHGLIVSRLWRVIGSTCVANCLFMCTMNIGARVVWLFWLTRCFSIVHFSSTKLEWPKTTLVKLLETRSQTWAE